MCAQDAATASCDGGDDESLELQPPLRYLHVLLYREELPLFGRRPSLPAPRAPVLASTVLYVNRLSSLRATLIHFTRYMPAAYYQLMTAQRRTDEHSA